MGAQLLIKSLFDTGAIDKNIMAFSIGKGDEPSSVSIGSYEPEGNVVPGTPIVWHKLTDLAFWEVNFKNPKIGNIPIHTNIQRIIVDTGTSFNLVPPNDYDQILNIIY